MGRNTLFRNFDNLVKVSVPGVAANLVTATGPGVTDKGDGLYTIKPQKGQELVLNITAELPDESTFSSSETFQIRRAPVPNILIQRKRRWCYVKELYGKWIYERYLRSSLWFRIDR